MQGNNAEQCHISGNIFRRTHFGGVTKAEAHKQWGQSDPLHQRSREKAQSQCAAAGQDPAPGCRVTLRALFAAEDVKTTGL